MWHDFSELGLEPGHYVSVTFFVEAGEPWQTGEWTLKAADLGGRRGEPDVQALIDKAALGVELSADAGERLSAVVVATTERSALILFQ